MEPELQKSDFADTADKPAVSPEQAGSLASAPAEGDNAEWQQILEQAYAVLSGLPEFIGKFYSEYRQPVVTVGLIVAALISVKLVLALIGAINEIPLLAPVFELIGLLYSGWFVYRYLLRVSSREELGERFNGLKDQVIGKQ